MGQQTTDNFKPFNVDLWKDHGRGGCSYSRALLLAGYLRLHFGKALLTISVT